MRNLRVAIWQMEPTRGDVEANLARLEKAFTDPVVRTADLLVAPEMFLTGFVPEATRTAARREGDLLERVSRLVASVKVAFACSVLTQRDGRQYNTFYLWGKDGRLLGQQDKVHLWDEEAKRATPGERVEPIPTEWGDVGGMVCYDVEFPEVSRNLAIAGAELLLVPSAFYSPTGWDVSTRARALENGCFLVAVNQIGGNPKHPHNGMSRVVSPFGDVLVEIPAGKEGFASVELDAKLVPNAREYAPFLRDRRLGVPAPAPTVAALPAKRTRKY